MARNDATFPTIRSEGGLLPGDLLVKIAASDAALKGFDPASFGLGKNDRVSEVIASAWEGAKGLWTAFGAGQQRVGAGDSGVTETRTLWILPLLKLLGYDEVPFRGAADVVEGRRFPISHRAGNDPLAPPVHIVSYKEALDTPQLTGDQTGPRRVSPHSLMQDYLNRTEHLWGIVTNGKKLRLLRDNQRLSRAAYLEIDLEAMLEGSVYADFVLFFLLLHRSRLPQPGQQPEDCLLEQWMEESEAQGTRALDELRRGVETAIDALGKGLVEHPDNDALRQALTSGTLSIEEYYRQLLRLVYRFLFLLAAEDRDLLFDEQVTTATRQRYLDWYSVGRLRELVARRRHADRHDDLWRSLQVTFRALRDEREAGRLGLEPLGGGLFDAASCAAIEAAQIDNARLLTAMRGLTFTEQNGRLQRINYRDMGVEELGSVYEGLLELQPRLAVSAAHPVFELGTSGERKSTGSYYTNSGLVQELIRSALDPVIAERLAAAATAEQKTAALLALNVCDPACGSGHFLLAAARRIGRELAIQASGDDEPDAAATRHGVRQAIQHCVYGVDLNPLAVDLCKVALWLEAHEPGKPIGFLDHHIRQGNALVGATEALMLKGIPTDAFKDVTGDDKKYAGEIRKRNTTERKGQLSFWSEPTTIDAANLGTYWSRMEQADDDLAGVEAKARAYEAHRHTREFWRRQLRADLWTAAFFWPLKLGEPAPPTDAYWNRLCADPNLVEYIGSKRAAELRDKAESRTTRLARRLSRDNHFFHWELEFEDVFDGDDPGFDVILANPPWEQVQLDPREFFAISNPRLANAANFAARERGIKALAAEDPPLYAAYQAALKSMEGVQKFIHASERFPRSSFGRLNTAPLFAEFTALTINTRGRTGVIVPTGIATDSFNQHLFNWFVSEGRLSSLFDFENREGLFPAVDSRLKFCLLTATAKLPEPLPFKVAFFLTQPQQLRDAERVFTLSAEEIELLNPNTRTCPIFRTVRDAEITKAIYRRVPVLVREGPPEVNPWGISFKLMFMMNTDSHLFRTREELTGEGFTLGADGRFRRDQQTWLPLYEAKLIHQYDHRFATFEGSAKDDKARPVTLAEHQDPSFVVTPRYWVDEREVERAVGVPREQHPGWFIGFRDITNATNERTAIFSVVPWAAISNKLPILQGFKSALDAACFLANVSSLVFDYATRQKIGGTSLNFFIVKQLPVLPPETFTPELVEQLLPILEELLVTSNDVRSFGTELSKCDRVHEWHDDRRMTLRSDLDAIFAKLYGLTRDDFSYVLDQFKIVRENDEKEFGEYRTKRLCLEAYDRWAGKI